VPTDRRRSLFSALGNNSILLNLRKEVQSSKPGFNGFHRLFSH
jgi:hypothetical protein